MERRPNVSYKPITLAFPDEDTIYKFEFLGKSSGMWGKWSDKLALMPPIAKDAAYNEIIVPTLDTVRYTFLMDMLITHQKAVLFVGPTGTGKSVYIMVCCSL